MSHFLWKDVVLFFHIKSLQPAYEMGTVLIYHMKKLRFKESGIFLKVS